MVIEWSAIWSENKRVITKSHGREAGVWFVITSLISDQNCTTRSGITNLLYSFWNHTQQCFRNPPHIHAGRPEPASYRNYSCQSCDEANHSGFVLSTILNSQWQSYEKLKLIVRFSLFMMWWKPALVNDNLIIVRHTRWNIQHARGCVLDGFNYL